MKNTKVVLLIAMTIFINLSACVSETTGDRVFRKPSEKDLETAMDSYVQLAYMHLENEDYSTAMLKIEQAMEIDANAPLVQNALAYVYEKQGDTEKAEETYKKAIRIDGNFSPARINYGNFLFKQGKIDDACKQFEAASSHEFYDRRAGAFFNLGLCEKKRGNYEEALDAFSRSVGLDRNYSQAYLESAEVKFDQGEYAEARKLYNRYAIELRQAKKSMGPKALWLGIRIERVFGNADKEASMALFLKNTYPYSKEYLLYKKSLEK